KRDWSADVCSSDLSSAIAARLGPSGRLVAFDRDPAAAADAEARFADDSRFAFCRSSFAELSARLQAMDLLGRIDGLLFDLGVSSPQIGRASWREGGR